MFHFGENYFRRSRFHGVFVLLIPFLSKPFWTETLVRIYACGVWRFPVIRSLASEISLSPARSGGFSFPKRFCLRNFLIRSFRKFALFQICPISDHSRRKFLRHLANLFILISRTGNFHLRNFYLYILSSQDSFLFPEFEKSQYRNPRSAKSALPQAYSRYSFAKVTPSYRDLPF